MAAIYKRMGEILAVISIIIISLLILVLLVPDRLGAVAD